MDYSYKLQQSKGLDTPALNLPTIWQTWKHRYKSRKQLHALLQGDADRLHQDLGISTKAALAEIEKPFWRR